MTSTASGVRSVFVLVVAGHLSVTVLATLTTASRGAGLPAGDIVVTAELSASDWGLVQVDPATGNRTILSDNTRGTGMPFTRPGDVSMMSNGDLLVADAGQPSYVIGPPEYTPPPGSPARLYLVDPTTGDRTVISQDSLTLSSPNLSYPEVGSGPGFGTAVAARQVGDQIVVSATDGDGSFDGKIMTVDPANGNRVLISSSTVGTGPALDAVGGVVASGGVLFSPGVFQGLLKIDLKTGDKIVISGANAGTGPALTAAFYAAPYGGQLYVSGAGNFNDGSTLGVFRVDPITGARTVITSSTVGSGPFGGASFMPLAIESGGTILLSREAADNVSNLLLTVDPSTGNRAILSDATHGSGPTFQELLGVTVVPLSGDANGDGIVNSQDIATIASQWNQSGYFQQGDLNNDGIVNAQDLALASSNWLRTSLGHGGLASAIAAASVPEPATLWLVMGCSLTWLLRMGRTLTKRALASALILVMHTAGVHAAGLPAGDIVVTADISAGDRGLMLIDPTTGNRTILSDNTRGTGMPFTDPHDVSVLSNGDLLVADLGSPVIPTDVPIPVPDSSGATNSVAPSPSRLYIVDPTTGDRTVISQDSMSAPGAVYPEIGSGPAFSVAGYARQVGNQILVSAANNSVTELDFSGRLMVVDPLTGNRATLSDANVGTGPAPDWMGGLVASGNTLFVLDYFHGVTKIDLTTGNRTPISGAGAGAGPAFTVGYDAAAYGGQIYVSGGGQSTNAATYGVFRIDPVTGNRSVVSSGTVGSGPLGISGPMQLAIESGGTILLTVQGVSNFNGLLTIDPLTGNRTFLSDATHGSGPLFADINGVTVVPLSGDANGDGIVNVQDLATIASQWSHNGYFLPGDLNNDGIVNGQDLALASSNWLGTSLGHDGMADVTNVAPIPEPATIVMFAVGMVVATLRWQRRTLSFAGIALMSMFIIGASLAEAAGLPAGDIVVSGYIDTGDTGLLLVDPTTGDRTILSDNTHGTGMPFTAPVVTGVLANGDLLVTDSANIGPEVYPTTTDASADNSVASVGRVYMVDPATGNRTILSESSWTAGFPAVSYPETGSGPALYTPGRAEQVGNQILLADGDDEAGVGRLMTINAATGDRRILSGPGIGTGPTLIEAVALAVSGNSAFVTDIDSGVQRIDLTTGNRTLLSGLNAGTGPALAAGGDMAVHDGQLFVTGGEDSFYKPSTYGVFRIDPVSGNRTLIAGPNLGTGPFGGFGFASLAFEPNGTMLLTANPSTDNSPSALLTLDPLTGNRTVLSDATHGAGPAFEQIYTVFVVPLAGDANGDGIVNGQDLATIASQWNHSGVFQAGDLNNNGMVNTQDLALASSNWLGTSLGQGGPANMSNALPVPEPATLLLSLVASLVVRHV